MRQIIRPNRIENTFKIFWIDFKGSTIKDSSLELDFNPFLSEILKNPKTINNFCLVHWQAKPKGLRRWGVYDYATKNYLAGDEIIFSPPANLPSTIQLNENRIKTLPTATLFYPNCKAVQLTNTVEETIQSVVIKIA